MKTSTSRLVPSPIGTILLQATADGICRVEIISPASGDWHEPESESTSGETAAIGHLDAAEESLREYFAQPTSTPSAPLDIMGTPFQRAVWHEIASLPSGETATYAEIAQRIGNPRAVRAVGAAVGANPVPLFIGCHRVLGSGGRITGYSGGEGLPTKRLLLGLESIGYRE